MSHTHAVIVKAHLWHAGKLLILKRREDDSEYGGYWDIPGGHLEEGESAHEGLRREVREETALAIGKIRPLTVWDYRAQDTRIIGLSFIARPETADVRLSAEHTDFAWMAPQEQDSYLFARNLGREIAWTVSKNFHHA